MKVYRNKVFMIFLLLTCFYIISDFNFMSLKSCNKAWDELRVEVVNDSSLEEVFKICDKKDGSKNYNILKSSLKDFSCGRIIKNLTVPRQFVALASFPGSGNTWTRNLIEAATGINTGSIYRDLVFVGSSECPVLGNVFIVKTHRDDNRLTRADCTKIGVTEISFSGAIYIIRNPYNAILAEFNRHHKNESIIGLAKLETFNTTEWSKFVMFKAKRWKEMTLTWLQRNTMPVFLLVYERLVQNVVLEVFNLMEFLNYKMQFRYIYCLSSDKTSKHKRDKPYWMINDNLYSNDLRKYVNSVIKAVKNTLDPKWNISELLDSYILHIDQ